MSDTANLDTGKEDTSVGSIQDAKQRRSEAMKKAWAKRKKAESSSPKPRQRRVSSSKVAVSITDKVKAAERLLELCDFDVKACTDCCNLVAKLQG